MIYRKTDIPADLQQFFVRAEIGLEETPEQFIAKLVDVFREVRRVLRDDGTAWVNMGDSYNNFRNGQCGQSVHAHEARDKPTEKKRGVAGLKEKDLMGIPWMLAFALRSDGWYLRQDIIWAKPNPMPESVTDRCTKSHEYIFLLSKGPRYYYDADAVKEPAVRAGDVPGGGRAATNAADPRAAFYRPENATKPVADERNKRSVWTVSTKPYAGAHFATYPEELIEPCILAGAPAGGVVLDPFFGSGTTGQVAQNLGRHWIGLELNPAYKALQDQRLRQPGLIFLDECPQILPTGAFSQ